MKKSTILILFAFFILPVLLIGQQNITFSGYIIDASTGEKLIGATIYDTATGKGTVSNNYGFFSLRLPVSKQSVIVSYVGYQLKSMELNLSADTFILFYLKADILLDEVTVVAENTGKVQSIHSPGLMYLSQKMIKELPVIMGERDIMKSLQLLPGVQPGSEANTGLYVRGGESDHNLVLLDGVEVFNPNHLFGFFSMFNDDAIKSVKIYTSGFPAQYSGRLASVVDIRAKDGNSHELKVKGSAGLIASRLQLEGPLIREKLTFVISARRTYLDIFAKPVTRHFTGYKEAGYFFYDVNGKINLRLNHRNNLYLSNYFGKDKGYFINENKSGINPPGVGEGYLLAINRQDVQWGNNLATLRYEYIPFNNLIVNFASSLSYYEYTGIDRNSNLNVFWNEFAELVENKSDYSLKTSSGVKSYTFSINFEHHPGKSHHLSYGAGTKVYQVNPIVENISVLSDTSILNRALTNKHHYVYLQDEISLGKRLTLRPGLTFVYYKGENMKKINLEKRFYAIYNISNKLRVNVGYAEMSQNLHMLSMAKINLASDLWLPSYSNIKPSESIDVSGGFTYIFLPDITFGLGIYMRKYMNLLLYKEGISFGSNEYSDYPEIVTSGKGSSEGVEFLVEKSSGSITGMLSYCYAISRRQFNEINQGETFRAQYDRPHNFRLMAVKHFNQKWSAGMVFTLMSGSMQTMGSGRYLTWFDIGESPYDKIMYNNLSSHDIITYRKNSYRLPMHHRLDISATYTMMNKKYRSSLQFGLYNAYNAKNPYDARLEFIDYGNNRTGYEIFNKSLFPVIPFVTYNFEF